MSDDERSAQISDRQARLEQVLADYLHSVEMGRPLDRSELLAAHPDLADELRSFFHNHDSIGRLAVPLKAAIDAPTILGISELGLASGGMTVRYFGDYELLDEIARGGMGVVYKARQVNLNRVVALKMILAGQLAHDSDVKRFYAEAEAAARLDHSGIVPIFEIGQHDGQHYFSMAFIEGESLAKKVIDGPMPPREAAEMVRKVAEAVEYAHQKGIIHRDLKPANVLLNANGQPKVTDFGLAKQTQGDSGLTGSGQILGTPSYMPPEQAAGKMDEVGPQADIYSLGAILYCLLTGRPPFQAASPIETLKAVIDHEPVAVRQLNPHVPLDLETIALKCLAKNPRDRYATAQALADDLAAFMDNRPISARRASIAERTVRWFRRQKRSVTIAAAASAAAVFIVIASWMAAGFYARSRLGYLQLNVTNVAGDRPDAAEVLNEQGELQQTISLPMREAVPLPAGAYHVRLGAAGRLSETYPVDVTTGDRDSQDVTLADAPLWKPLPLSAPYLCGFIKLAGETRMLVGPQDTALPIAACYSGRIADLSGNPLLLWKVDWSVDSPPVATVIGPAEQRAAWQQFLAAWGQAGYEPRLVQPAPDLDGDGTGELAWWYGNGIVAASSRDGHPLWCYRPTDSTGAVGQIAAPPIVVVSPAPPDGAKASRAVVVVLCALGGETWLEALASPLSDAPAGRPAVRWRHPLVRGIAETAVPFADCTVCLCRMAGRPVVVSVAGRQLAGDDPFTGLPVWPVHELGARPAAPPTFADLDGDGQEEVLLVHPDPKPGEHPLQAISLAPSGPREFWRTTVRHQDFLLPTTRRPVMRMMPAGQRDNQEILPSLRDASEAAPWPCLVDLDGDQKPEIVVPAKFYNDRWQLNGVVVLDGTTGKVRWERHWPMHSFGKAVGFFNAVKDAYVAGPDIDGDGCRELFVVSVYDEQHRENITKSGTMYRYRGDDFLYIDCLSGRDGHSLWWSREPLGSAAGSLGGAIGPLVWWGSDSDGLPQLVVPVIRHLDVAVERAYVVSAATGRVLRFLRDSARPVAVDVDSDGLADLATFQPDDPKTFETISGQAESGKLRIVRGTPAESFRRLGAWTSVADFDGDGQPELVRQTEPVRNQTLAVMSGRDGRIESRWRADWGDRNDTTADELVFFPLPRGDFDGDGITDLILQLPKLHLSLSPRPFPAGPRRELPLQVLSGRTGLPIWREPVVPLPAADAPDSEWQQAFRYQPKARVLRVTDVDGDGRSELLCDVSWDCSRFVSNNNINRSQRSLALISAHDGKVQWIEPYGEFALQTIVAYFSWFDLALAEELADLDGDGFLDMVFVPPQLGADGAWSAAAEARSGRDGRRLWQTPLVHAGSSKSSVTPGAPVWVDGPTIIGTFEPPLVSDLDGDGRAEIVLHELPRGRPEPKISLLEGATGERLWTRSSADIAVVVGREAAGSDSRPVGTVPKGIAVLSPAATNPEIVLLDKAGNVLDRTPAGRMWGIDLDGDGVHELVIERIAGRFEAYSRGLNHKLWDWQSPGGWSNMRLESLPGRGPALLATAVDSQFLLDPATGRSQWRTRHDSPWTNFTLPVLPAAGSDDGVAGDDGATRRKSLFVPDQPMNRGTPLALTISRRLEPTRPDGAYLAVTRSSRAPGPASLPVDPHADDPRLARRLPWDPGFEELANGGAQGQIAISAVACIVASIFALPLLVIVIPGRLVRSAMRRGQSLRSRAFRVSGAASLVAAAISVAAVFATVVFPIGAVLPWPTFVELAVVLLPAVFWPAALLRLIRESRWKSLAGLLLATLAAAIAWGGVLLWSDRAALDQPLYQLHYVRTGWWFVLFGGAYAIGWLLIAIRVFGPPLGWLRRRVMRGSKVETSNNQHEPPHAKNA